VQLCITSVPATNTASLSDANTDTTSYSPMVLTRGVQGRRRSHLWSQP